VEVVLRQDVDHVGLRGEVVNVARGYARNYLLPRGLAEVATPGLKRELERRESLKARNEAKDTGEAEAIAKRLEATELKFEVNAGPTGSLFGSVTATNVVDRLWDEQKIRLDRRKLGMQTIKRVGRYTVPAEIFAEVVAELRILVVPEGGELPPDEPEATETAVATEASATEAPAEVTDTAPAAPAEEPVETVAEETPAAETPAAEAEVAEVEDEARVEPPAAEEALQEEPPAAEAAAEPVAVADEPVEDAPVADPGAEDAPPAPAEETS
jgi:large subunit ribosomal protein L9